MESMSDIVWSVNPDNDNLESVMTRVSLRQKYAAPAYTNK